MDLASVYTNGPDPRFFRLVLCDELELDRYKQAQSGSRQEKPLEPSMMRAQSCRTFTGVIVAET